MANTTLTFVDLVNAQIIDCKKAISLYEQAKDHHNKEKASCEAEKIALRFWIGFYKFLFRFLFLLFSI